MQTPVATARRPGDRVAGHRDAGRTVRRLAAGPVGADDAAASNTAVGRATACNGRGDAGARAGSDQLPSDPRETASVAMLLGYACGHVAADGRLGEGRTPRLTGVNTCSGGLPDEWTTVLLGGASRWAGHRRGAGRPRALEVGAGRAGQVRHTGMLRWPPQMPSAPCQVSWLDFDATDPQAYPALIDEVFSRPVDVVVVAFGVLGDPEHALAGPAGCVRVAQTNYVGAVSVGVLVGRAMRRQAAAPSSRSVRWP